MDIYNFRVAPDGNSLELWVEVPSGPYYNDIKMTKICIIDQSKFKSTTVYPSTNNKIEFSVSSEDEFNKITNPKKFVKRISLTDSATQMLLNSKKAGMYYVYIQVTGIPAEETPCCCFKELTVGCAINHYPVYNLMLKIINSYQDRCFIAEDKLLDLYLKKQLISQAVELSDYVTANEIYNELYKREIEKGQCLDACGSKNLSKSGKCGSC
jgi:endoglucanase Acf2